MADGEPSQHSQTRGRGGWRWIDCDKTVLLTHLIEGLCERGNWCGETHVQKTAFFVQELMGVPMEFRFILYKHGPFSFDLRDELTALRANGLLGLEPRSYGGTACS